ncbi:hypothetical protein [Marinospirillum sp.]|uniref:hypothetical protein n=1 Tax=Marinospirillum sp. TaxID=2183934 RepID=UPI0028704CAC|nr:hypothetical protein [Marinospirillum sp.]MDR9467789.1 hypothetical protein [Marinospirillum sp.]
MLTFILAFLAVVAFSLLMLYVGRHSFRQRPEKLLHLVRQARAGQLDEKAWTYGLSQPYYHAPEVNEIREQLLDLEGNFWAGKRQMDRHKQDFLLNEEGLRELERIQFRLEKIIEKRAANEKEKR